MRPEEEVHGFTGEAGLREQRLATPPLFDALKDASRILFAGAGGGFDFYSALPLYFAFRNLGKEVFLANASFSDLSSFKAEAICEGCLAIRSDSETSTIYHPELSLARWFREQGEEVTIYAFEAQLGTRELGACYRALVERHEVDAVVLVDGGTDILMGGDEASLGTPSTDISSLVAVAALELDNLYLSCLGFGVDAFHGLCHYQFLENVAALSQAGGFLGVQSLQSGMPEVELYKAAIDFANKDMSFHPSIVCNSIKSAIEGHYGDYHATARTKNSELWINPLMTFYWNFELRAVFERCLYKDQILATDSLEETQSEIYKFRQGIEKRRAKDIPL